MYIGKIALIKFFITIHKISFSLIKLQQHVKISTLQRILVFRLQQGIRQGDSLIPNLFPYSNDV